MVFQQMCREAELTNDLSRLDWASGVPQSLCAKPKLKPYFTLWRSLKCLDSAGEGSSHTSKEQVKAGNHLGEEEVLE